MTPLDFLWLFFIVDELAFALRFDSMSTGAWPVFLGG